MTNVESQKRSSELHKIAIENDLKKSEVDTGTKQEIVNMTKLNKEKILKYFNASLDDWQSYNWQISHRISNVQVLNDIFKLKKDKYTEIEEVSKKYRWSISPYYLSLVDFNNSLDEIGLMCIPFIYEINNDGELDPMSEEFTNPAGSITRRYPDRLIINVTNMCGMYCRFCQRKRNIGEIDSHKLSSIIDESIRYIEDNKEIRDVLITGGDPLTLSNKSLENIISRIRNIKHVEIIRIGTRIPVTIPARIDDSLVNMLKKYHPLYINVQFNHPREITKETIDACNKLADAGIPLGNQAVLLNGINNDKYVMLKLNQELLKIRVRPYYIFQAKNVLGTTHFKCDIKDGIEIVNFLRGNTSGLAIPTYIVNAPSGLGKVQLAKSNCEFLEDENIIIRTWEGKELLYKNYRTVKLEELIK